MKVSFGDESLRLLVRRAQPCVLISIIINSLNDPMSKKSETNQNNKKSIVTSINAPMKSLSVEPLFTYEEYDESFWVTACIFVDKLEKDLLKLKKKKSSKKMSKKDSNSNDTTLQQPPLKKQKRK
eukprot:832383_1